MIYQLKPREEAFLNMVFKLKHLDAIVLCEGKTEAEVYKKAVQKLELQPRASIGVTDSEGLTNVSVFAGATSLLASYARKIKLIAVIVDAEEKTIGDRLRSLIDSITAKGIEIPPSTITRITEQVYTAKITSLRELKLIIAISGDHNTPYTKHTIEDHLVKLAILEQKLDQTTAKQTLQINQIDPVNLVQQASPENIKQALNHLATLAQQINNTLQETHN